ncbi:MAG: hypothetical protein ACJA1Z_001796 [Patiriisocius sp.]
MAVQWLNEVFCLLSSSVLAESFRLRNRRLLLAAKRYSHSPYFRKENNYSELNLVCGEKAKGQLKIKVLILVFRRLKKTLLKILPLKCLLLDF